MRYVLELSRDEAEGWHAQAFGSFKILSDLLREIQAGKVQPVFTKEPNQ